MPPSRRGIWAETAPPEALRDPATYRLLARHGLEVALAVRPADVERVGGWLSIAEGHGVRASLWPMIDDAAGRWLSTANVEPFRDFVREVRARAPRAEVVLDLEPPLPLVRGALDGRRDAMKGLASLVRDGEARGAGEIAIEELCREIRGSGAALTLAVVPFVLWDGRASAGWSRLFGPARELPATRANVMLYTTLIRGYSKGLLRLEDARALLAEGCSMAAERFGERAAVSLGAVGIGALGDEPVYEDPAALAADVAVAEARGVDDLWLFDLGGALSRGAPEAWLSALVTSAPRSEGSAALRPTLRSRVASAVLRALGRALATGARSVEPGAPRKIVAEHGTRAQ